MNHPLLIFLLALSATTGAILMIVYFFGPEALVQ